MARTERCLSGEGASGNGYDGTACCRHNKRDLRRAFTRLLVARTDADLYTWRPAWTLDWECEMCRVRT